MPIYEYRCPIHGDFEVLQSIDAERCSSCPKCGAGATKVLSRIAQIKVIHTERLPFNATERVDDRRRMMKDSAVMKALSDFAEEQRSQQAI